jgi:hypothetical protein
LTITNTGFVITDEGNAQATVADPGGPYIHITEFRVSDAVDFVPDGDETALPGTVLYTGGITNYYVVNYNTIELILIMDPTVGPFSFGSIGIYLEDGTLFAICAFDGLLEKIRALGNQAGTQYRIRARLKFARASVICQVDVITSLQVLEVDTWSLLVTPGNQVGEANMAIVHEATPGNDSVMVFRDTDDQWSINDFGIVFTGDTDDAGVSIEVDRVVHPDLVGMEFDLPSTDSRYLIRFPDGDIRRVSAYGDDNTELVFTPAKAVPLTGVFTIWEDASSATQNCKVRWADRSEYNSIVADFNVLWGDPSGTYPGSNEGLGQVEIPTISSPARPSLADWTAFHNALIEKCKIHSVGFSDILATDYTYLCNNTDGKGLKTHMDQFEVVLGKIDSLITNRNVADAAYQESSIPGGGTATRTDAWNGTKNHIVTFSYDDADHKSALINGGHQISWSASVTTGATLWWTSLKDFLTSIGTVTFGRGTTTKTGGVGTGSSVGLATLTTTPQVMFTASGLMPGSGEVDLQISGETNLASDEIIITVTFGVTVMGGYSYYVALDDDLLTSLVSVRRPQAAVIATPVLDYPTVVSTGTLEA